MKFELLTVLVGVMTTIMVAVVKFELLTVLVGVMTTIMVAGLPWAYRMGERISSIEAKVKMILELRKNE